MFIWPGSVHYFAEAPGIYNDEGNEWVAKKLYEQLIAIPEVIAKLGSRPGSLVAAGRLSH